MTLRKISVIFAIGFAATSLPSCDDGDIYEEYATTNTDGLTVKFRGTLTGTQNWSSSYSLVIAGFADTDYSVVQKVLPAPRNDGENEVEVTLSNVGGNVRTIEFCVTNKLRERIVTFHTHELTGNETDTVTIDVGKMDVGMYATIQRNIFNTTCTQCHGASTGSPAAGLLLTEGVSYASLVSQPSTRIEEGTLVVPGNAEGSILHQTINTGYGLPLRFDHTNMISNSNWLTLIDKWIDNGAEEF